MESLLVQKKCPFYRCVRFMEIFLWDFELKSVRFVRRNSVRFIDVSASWRFSCKILNWTVRSVRRDSVRFIDVSAPSFRSSRECQNRLPNNLSQPVHKVRTTLMSFCFNVLTSYQRPDNIVLTPGFSFLYTREVI